LDAPRVGSVHSELFKAAAFLSLQSTLKTESANERTANRGSRAMIGAGQGIVCLRLRGNEEMYFVF